MTKQEAYTISLFTGILMMPFEEIQKYVKEKYKIQLYRERLVDKDVEDKLKALTKSDFIMLCLSITEEEKNEEKID